MNMWVIVGGPLVAALTVGFMIWSGIITFGDAPGLEHQAGAEKGSTFVLSIDPETGSTEVEGLDMEIEEEPIEYREGDEITTARKLNGLNKYANIQFRWPTGFDTKNWRFIFAREAALEKVREEYDDKQEGKGLEKAREGEEMYQINPPTLIIPVN